MLIVGYCFGVRSERRLSEEVHQSGVSLVGSGSTARCPIVRRSRRTAVAVSATAIYCGDALIGDRDDCGHLRGLDNRPQLPDRARPALGDRW
jgi:hypothetical protein